jgi:hypothetical protein
LKLFDRNRTAKFNKAANHIRNTHYASHNLSYEERLKPHYHHHHLHHPATLTRSSLSYSNQDSSIDKEYTDGYGRV